MAEEETKVLAEEVHARPETAEHAPEEEGQLPQGCVPDGIGEEATTGTQTDNPLSESSVGQEQEAGTEAHPPEQREPDWAKFEEMLKAVMDGQEKNDIQLANALRGNMNFQAQVREGMQRELEELRKWQRGEQFTPILKDIAAVYAEYQMILDDGALSEKTRKNILAMFEQIEDILAEYGAEIFRSGDGDERNIRASKIIHKIPTDDKALHGKVAKSLRPGVVRGKTALYNEYVDVYVCDPAQGENTAPEA